MSTPLSTSAHRARRRSRLTAICTAAVIAVGGYTPLAQAAEEPAGATVAAEAKETEQSAPALPRLTEWPERNRAEATTRAAATGSRTDFDGDGIGDVVARDNWVTGLWVSTSSGEYGDWYLGETGFTDVILPGNILDGEANDLLTLTASGHLTLFSDVDVTNPEPLASWYGTGWQIYNKVLSPGDLTGDGRPDLLGRLPNGDLYLYRSTGDYAAPFAARVKVGSAFNQFDQLVGAGDLTGDGLGDVLARNTKGELFLYRGTGDAANPLATRTTVGAGWAQYNQIFGVDDFDGDGVADLLARQYDGTMYFYSGNGAGGFAGRLLLEEGWQGPQLAGAGGNGYFGKNDFHGRTSAGTLWWYVSNGDGTLQPRQDLGADWGSDSYLVYASALTDFMPGDELVRYNPTGELYAYWDGSLVGPGWNAMNLIIGPGDLNADGKGDLIARDRSGNLYLYRGQGTGNSFASRILIGGGWNMFDRIVGSGDVTGDGRPDILARTSAGELFLYRGTGNSTAPFAARQLVGSGWNMFRNLTSPGDLDGDGYADLVGSNSAGELYFYSADHTGGFKGRVRIGNSGWNGYTGLF
ncbi:FG-GAP repeat domain-containing protein [Allostreptomyces psammosilenae]|uniref:VCBS repeat-containing protein n=1 Tax=Allostreptomyces psammosilenae TaxID=1892865 RepID=A0A852ZUX2_9ACTN|nr:VCBS repeat-containing protein [Allostreptomyces psammosilenae]NYI06193.1 hypothetical protein [Allostreptomyces psammosilenae]